MAMKLFETIGFRVNEARHKSICSGVVVITILTLVGLSRAS